MAKYKLPFRIMGLVWISPEEAKNYSACISVFIRISMAKVLGCIWFKLQVESLGGTINLTSEVNNGTKFTIELEAKESTFKTPIGT